MVDKIVKIEYHLVIERDYMETEITRLTIELDKAIRKEVKKRAVLQNLTMKQWVLEAIYEKIKQEKHLGFK